MKRLMWIFVHLIVCGTAGIVFFLFTLFLSKGMGAKKYYILLPLDGLLHLADIRIQSDNFDVVIPLIFGYMALLGITIGTAIVLVVKLALFCCKGKK